ncbi:hypothetical protein BUALT_Bualt03G0045300 [Buddleja alternifolia]|uniref:Uncharacterized protein n=1 Tax=Buddleja alternifolia TaxID=168488 RepID=A0AAV6XT84_9LAMI|nr:hypothetical protein BUALT_Bualt03G0045300 [Buddleja alternifolia]
MKNTIRCCISCILPCGVLDVIRIVHANGHVEEISGSVTAAEIMKLHPKHVLKKPSSPSGEDMCPKIVVVPPDAELQRGKIYFLMPLPPAREKSRSRSSTKKKRKESENKDGSTVNAESNISVTNLLISDRYLSEILSENVSMQRDRRRGRVGVWRPHLDSISETPSEA